VDSSYPGRQVKAAGPGLRESPQGSQRGVRVESIKPEGRRTAAAAPRSSSGSPGRLSGSAVVELAPVRRGTSPSGSPPAPMATATTAGDAEADT
jgi:hypothetical protein